MIINSSFDYKPHLKIAYIDPIRTVTVIDDEYPTLDDLIENDKNSFDPENINRLKEIISISRSTQYNWLLDVYNGKEKKVQEGSVSNRLHHSDLLILDYHLDGEDSGYCKKSIDIIKNLSQNRNFNIVAVHTKGYTGEKGSVQDVLIDIIISLQKRPVVSIIPNGLARMVDENIDEWSFDDADIREKLISSISTLDLLQLMHKFGNKICSSDFTHEKLAAFDVIYDEKPEAINLSKSPLIRWLCSEKMNNYSNQFSTVSSNYFEWGTEDKLNWIKTEDLFLTVLGKRETPISEIPNQLLAAMEKSRPHPHKLILSKLRTEIESNGGYAASNILNKKYLQAAWLKELLNLNNDNNAIKTAAWLAITKLWEELAYEIKPQLDKFTVDMVCDLKKMDSPLEHFIEQETLNDESTQIIHANCFSCSKKISTHHLITGHILEFKNNYWLCLTPMCDLVPGQKMESSMLPVTLVQMYDAKSALRNTRENMRKALSLETVSTLSTDEEIRQILSYATHNNLLFIRPEKSNDNITILSFTVGLDGKANPKARDYFVDNQGIFENENKMVKLKLAQPNSDSGNVEIENIDAHVVAELRYEYALNLLSRLGVSKSRIGLDFIN